jgi:hypothetical protein
MIKENQVSRGMACTADLQGIGEIVSKPSLLMNKRKKKKKYVQI